jgi:TetR/AcrR family tetracycline transcriptional repressor
MATTSRTTAARAGRRTPLNREQIIRAALSYIDEHGLDGLSMHKLGAELGVQGMSLYHYVASKDDVLDGVVELLWQEAEGSVTGADWRATFRSFARTVRDVVLRHPNAALLIVGQAIMPEPALRAIQARVAEAVGSGVGEDDAYALLRTVCSYALGTALNEVAWGACQACAPADARGLVRPGVAEELAKVAETFCGQADSDGQFELGLDLMLRGCDHSG